MQRDITQDEGEETEEEALFIPREEPPSSMTVDLLRRQERPPAVVHIRDGAPETLEADLPWFQRQLSRRSGTWNHHVQRAALQRLGVLTEMNMRGVPVGHITPSAVHVFTIRWRVVVAVGFYRLAECAWKIGETARAKAYADELYRAFDDLRSVMPWQRPDRWPASYKWGFVGVVPSLHALTLFLRDIFVKIRSEAQPGVEIPAGLRRPPRIYAVQMDSGRSWRPGDPVWGSQQWEWTARVVLNAERIAVWVGGNLSRSAMRVNEALSSSDDDYYTASFKPMPDGIAAPSFLRETIRVARLIAAWRDTHRQTIYDHLYFVSSTPPRS